MSRRRKRGFLSTLPGVGRGTMVDHVYFVGYHLPKLFFRCSNEIKPFHLSSTRHWPPTASLLHRGVMGTRIVVRCKSQQIPGDPKLRPQTIANIVCQRIWHRKLDNTQDRIQSRGRFDCDGVRCFFLLDNGPPDSQEVKTSMYNWDGSCL